MSLSALFDRGVVLHSGVPKELASSARLYPEEERAIERAVVRRKEEFAATRHLARLAFAAFGLEPQPLSNRSDRSPAWPAGLVGSVTHTDGFCAVAVARSDTHRSLGIDAEVDGRVGAKLFPRVLTEREIEFVTAFEAARHEQLATVLFSAKESFYKCQHPLTGRLLGFHDVEVDLDLVAGRFSVRVLTDEPRLLDSAAWLGRFVFDGAVVVTAVSCSQSRLT